MLYKTPKEVYFMCMARTNIDIDEIACQKVIDKYKLSSKREAVNLALRRLASEKISVDDARSIRGIGWDADLDEIRKSRSDDFN